MNLLEVTEYDNEYGIFKDPYKSPDLNYKITIKQYIQDCEHYQLQQ